MKKEEETKDYDGGAKIIKTSKIFEFITQKLCCL